MRHNGQMLLVNPENVAKLCGPKVTATVIDKDGRPWYLESAAEQKDGSYLLKVTLESPPRSNKVIYRDGEFQHPNGTPSECFNHKKVRIHLC